MAAAVLLSRLWKDAKDALAPFDRVDVVGLGASLQQELADLSSPGQPGEVEAGVVVLVVAAVRVGPLPQQVPGQVTAGPRSPGHPHVALPAGVHQRRHPRAVLQLHTNTLNLKEVLDPFHVPIIHALEQRVVRKWLWLGLFCSDILIGF